jgi:hypothetical protein
VGTVPTTVVVVIAVSGDVLTVVVVDEADGVLG